MLGAEELFQGNTYKGDVFSGSALENITIPSTLKVLQKGTFTNCVNLTDIQLPEGFRQIENDSFSNSGLTQITLPRSLKKVDVLAFSGCGFL